MLMPDVNVLVAAWAEEHEQHAAMSAWLDQACVGDETVGLSVQVIAGTVRVTTNSRVFARPLSVDAALENIDMMLALGCAELVYPGPAHVGIFSSLCRAVNASGNLVSDAQHAAIAIEHDATWVSLDRDFARFPGLKWVLPS
jgi:toxin-antitoxin system PIN domain toxin